jgi:Domain of unknown function (DUF4114)/PKD domain
LDGASVSAGGPYTINQGQGLSLSGSATPAANSTILSRLWDVNGDGTYGEATGLTPTLTWAKLVDLGLGHPGTYTIGFRVTSDNNTVDAYSTVTVAYVAPIVHPSGADTGTTGVPYRIDFSADLAGVEPITGWTVTWGDGSTTELPSDATSAVHTYTSSSAFGIVVTAADAVGSATAGKTVTVTEGPATISIPGPQTIQVGDGLVLRAQSYGSPTSFAWDVNGDGTFGDATGSAGAPVNNVVTSEVTLTWADLQAVLTAGGVVQDAPQALANVRVRVTYAGGNTVTSTPTAVTILDTPPTAAFTGTDTVVGGSSTVSFANPESLSAALTRVGFTYSYDFDNDNVFEVVNSADPSAAVPAALLAHGGTRTIHGRISDAAGGASDYVTEIVVADVAPQVAAGPDQTVAAEQTVSVAATFSYPGYDTPGRPETFSASIDWGDGSSSPGKITLTSGPGVATAGTVTGSHRFAAGRTYQVTVTVANGNGQQGSDSFQVVVAAPVIAVNVPGTQVVTAGDTITLENVTFSNTAAPVAHTVVVSWGDGSSPQTLPASAVAEPALPGDLGALAAGHAYGQAGLFTVAVQVTDALGHTQSGSFPVAVANAVPTVVAGPDQDAGLGVTVHLNSSFSDPGFPVGGTGETYTATIDWGDGTTSPGTVVTTPGGPGVPTTGTVQGGHSYTTPGDHTVTVRVHDGSGQDGTDTLVVRDPAPTLSPVPDMAGDEGSPISLPAVAFSYPGFPTDGVPATFTATIDWGDGTTSPGVVTTAPGGPGVPTTGTVTGSHTYATFGSFPVTVRVANAGGAAGEVTAKAVVRNLAPTLGPWPNNAFILGQDFDLVIPFDDPGTITFTVTPGDALGQGVPKVYTIPVAPVASSLRLEGQVLVVEGDPKKGVVVSIPLVSHEATHKNEIGFIILDADQRLNGLAPGQPGFVRAALRNRGVLFRPGRGRTRAARALRVPAGARVLFYLIQDGSAGRLLARNPANRVGRGPLAFFSLPQANPDHFNHVRIKTLGGGRYRLAFEDLTGGGDRDFNDAVIEVKIDEQGP